MEAFRAENLTVEKDDGIATLWLDVPGKTYNVFNRQVLADLDKAFDRIAPDSSIKLLFIRGRKKNGFVAGADLHEFQTITTGEQATALSAAGQKLFDKLERLPFPTVAVIHGPCLGGGLEFALACDYRIVIDHPKTQIGLPEIELGLVPGWGGTQRLVRVVGLERALQVILQRHRLNAREAAEWGLADWCLPVASKETQDNKSLLTSSHLPLGTLPGFRISDLKKRPKHGMPLRNWRQRLIESTSVGRSIMFRGAERILRRKVPDDMPAPFEALEAVRVGLTQGMSAGLVREREAIGRLATTKACRNLMTLFFLIERARKLQEDIDKDSVPEIKRVGVVGAGTMGAGIAQLAALKGFEVVVQEVNDSALAAGIKKIEDLFQKAAERRLLSPEEAKQKMAAVGRTTAWQGFEKTDLVIEAVIEDLKLKKEVFRELEKRTRANTILASNTSSLVISQLQEGLTHPERVAGLHFFNPVHKMPLLEVVRTAATEERVAGIVTQWAAAVGKTPVVVGDGPGFVVNRILMPYLNEAGMLVAEGMPVDKVDHVMRRFGMPMGPLELLDQVGLDVATHIAKSVGPAFGERMKPHPALDLMCQAGWLGQKSGLGFYRYQGKKRTVHSEALAKLREQLGSNGKNVATENTEDIKSHGSVHSVASVPRDNSDFDQARERMVCLMVNEAAAVLAEGLAESADVIDLAMVLGTGWAPHRGGPLRYADDRGAGEIVKTLENLAQRLGPRFEPCVELRNRAASGELFYAHLTESLARAGS
jgi:3-hydroxyacyl-CoA dehydrogenase/enoyl-CoA hydratase/3-hydroxybutyryl-CoA epimerase